MPGIAVAILRLIHLTALREPIGLTRQVSHGFAERFSLNDPLFFPDMKDPSSRPRDWRFGPRLDQAARFQGRSKTGQLLNLSVPTTALVSLSPLGGISMDGTRQGVDAFVAHCEPVRRQTTEMLYDSLRLPFALGGIRRADRVDSDRARRKPG